MKKPVGILLAACLTAAALTGCGAGTAKEGAGKTIVVGASVTPHAEILKVAGESLKEQGYTLDIREFDDYIQPNVALDSGELDANYFQHQTYLDDFNKENGTKIVSIADVHYEPMGIYPGKTDSLENLSDKAKIAVPNDPTNEARALLLLEANGLIELAPEAGIAATVTDIVKNPKDLEIVEIAAAQMGRSLNDVDLAVINGNYAIKAGLNVSKDAIAKEEKDSLAAEKYVNVLAVKEGDENREDLKALAEALKSDEVKKFMEEKYEGAVMPID